jgi:hypothetical protein
MLKDRWAVADLQEEIKKMLAQIPADQRHNILESKTFVVIGTVTRIAVYAGLFGILYRKIFKRLILHDHKFPLSLLLGWRRRG